MIEDKIIITSNEMSLYYYEKYYRNNMKHPVSNTFYKNTFKPKNFKYFEKASQMFCIRDDFNSNRFIDSCLADGFKYPAQIPLESNWNRYLAFIVDYKDPEKELVYRIISGAKELKKYDNNVEKLLEDKIIKDTLYKNNTRFDPLILYFSKAFNNFYKENIDKFIKKIDISLKRYPVFEYERIINKIKQILGNDYFKEEINDHKS